MQPGCKYFKAGGKAALKRFSNALIVIFWWFLEMAQSAFIANLPLNSFGVL